MAVPVIKVSNLRKEYKIHAGPFWRRHLVRTIKALDGISFEVKQKEIFGLLGPNGAGKTTTINIISGLLYPDAGKIQILGQNIFDPAVREKVVERMNVATAYSSLHERLSVGENLKIFGKIFNVQDIDKKIAHLLEIFEINDLRDKRIWDLSTGQKTRVNICKALINDPEILLLDEITVGLDPDIADKTRQIIKQLPKKAGSTILLTSHNMEDIERLCDKIAFLHKGRILRVTTPAKLRAEIKQQIVEVAFQKITPDIRATIEAQHGYIKKNKAVFKIGKSEKIHDVIKPMFEKEYKVKDIYVRKPKLEDVFIKFAREEEKEII